jgi:acyl transferase domain-containing protein/3-hydroxymyristoyl/3-hydroxydecanoyl-(acyl carrier protein) dehydratase/1-acyl-sn-glycerol-3-phosphate acyltransferase
MSFEPIAIVGQACTLPGALTPAALWDNVVARKSCLSRVPADRWRLAPSIAMGTAEKPMDRTWSDMGGYVHGFDSVFDPKGFALAPEEVLGLDPVFQWSLHGVREALRTMGHDGPSSRVGLVMGNLSFPSSGMVRYAESVWIDAQAAGVLRPNAAARAGISRPHARNRFSSGLPAHLTARALGLGGGAFALDAACASSLYAIKLACDRLHDRTADVMVAGAVNSADDLFIHIGFCALAAMSRTGQSRPFHRDADGLVPAEGAGFVALQRLGDALAAGRKVLGVIRGVGLSNDGRGRGLLAPSEEGQERAMRLAYASAEIAPSDIGMIECHATGTVVGDATEVRSTARVFEGCSSVPIGSLKSNLGHLITAAGAAGLMKVLAAMESGRRPATLHADQPIEALAGTPFRLLREAEDWTGPRRAALSAFGFGGNNAHLIVEAWDGKAATPVRVSARSTDRVAIVGIGARVADGESAQDFAKALFAGVPRLAPRSTVTVALDGVKFPPRDLSQTLAQQLLVLEAAREASVGVSLPRERTSVLVGMGCDPEVARYGVRWRMAQWAEAWASDSGSAVDPAWLVGAQDAFQSGLQAAGVVGTMPNIPANRICSQLDVAGPGFTVSAEEASGLAALEIAARALRAGEIDAALVGAVDLSHEIVHRSALDALGHSRAPGDAAVVLVLKRLADATRDGDPIYALLGGEKTASLVLGTAGAATDLGGVFGNAHAATGLVHVAAAALALRHGARPNVGGPAMPWFGERAVDVSISVLEAPVATVRLEARDTASFVSEAVPRLHVFSGADQTSALASLAAGREGEAGPARLVIVAVDAAELAARADRARRWLDGGGPAPEGVAFRASPIEGEIAYVFTGAAAAYTGMGRDLTLAMPALAAAVNARCGEMDASTAWLYGPGDGAPKHPLDQLWGTSYVCQLHAELSQRAFGLSPAATIGYSSGESNALFAMGAWTDLDAMIRETRGGTIFTRDLVGAFDAPRRAWSRLGSQGTKWLNFSVAGAVDDVRAALTNEPLVHLTIVNTPESCVIGGEAEACERVVKYLGSDRAIPLGYEIAAHCPEVEEIRDAWWRLHRRATRDVPGVRFYTNATGSSFQPTPEAAADAITGQALRTLDFPRVIEQAYADGVRVFLEHGPRGLCSGWIKRILGDRDHVAVPLDVAGRSGVRQAMNAAAWLVSAGVKLDMTAFEKLASVTPKPSGAMLTLPAHPLAPRIPTMEAGTQVMEKAPWLPPVLDEVALPIALETSPIVTHAVATPSTPMTDMLTRMTAHQAQLAGVHRDFLAQQAEVHQRFLALRQSTEAGLLRAYGSAVRGHAAMPSTVSPHPSITRAPVPTTSTLPLPLPSGGVPARKAALPGPKFDRAQLEVLAGGKISSVFGALFAPQDEYRRQVRMPEPPLLLADRVTGIDAAAGSMGTGTLWTETDVRQDSWYLDDQGRMPAGVMIEAGQADLLLISWLGVDLLNRGERVYRLLGCELTYHGGLCAPGDTLVYDIHIDGHANQGDIRLFFFHYDCRVNGASRLTVRHGQAGFFTDEELANSAGVLWDCAEEKCTSDAPLDPPAVVCTKPRLDASELRAFADGRPFDCFGPGWEYTQSHVRSPGITSGKMLFLREVTAFDPKGGPWGRGYLRAETPVTPDDWFFGGHFKNDPCMPGTLMFEGCLQAMAVYITALGFTVDRDGWRFEPVPDQKYPMRCRGQVTPTSKHLTYEVFVSEVVAGPIPMIYADLLCTVDGRKAFHAGRVGLQLVPDWPLNHWKQLGPATSQLTAEPVALRKLGGLRGYVEPKPVAEVDGFKFDYTSLIACAWGPPSHAFGPFYSAFDGTRRVARLPSPPYHFMSRVTFLDAPLGGMKQGSTIEVEYDLPTAQWYFDQNGHPSMPFCVLMEAALQPCGWLASYVGSARTSETDLLFRNLDGTGIFSEEILPVGGTLRTKVTLVSISQTAGMIIETFKVECFVGDQTVFTMSTVFGFFPKEAFENQAGLPVSDEARARIEAPSEFFVDLTERPARYCDRAPRLAGPMLLMLDRVTGYWPEGGRAKLGYLRAEKTVDPDEWFFKAHFFQDPVQPGSLGIEAMCQLLQFYMLERDMGAGLTHPHFEPVMLGRAVTWKYRGQVVPKNRTIMTEVEITEVGEDDRGRFAIAEAWLWVDGKRVYHAKNLGMRIVAGTKALAAPPPAPVEESLDPAKDTWLADHCPTWTLPALPMMSMVDRMTRAAKEHAGREVSSLSDVQVRRWLPFPDGAVRLRTEVVADGEDLAVTLHAWREASDPALSRFEPVATAKAHMAPSSSPPAAFAPLADAVPAASPYTTGSLFHGPAFQYMTALSMGSAGASGVLRAELGTVPRGLLHQGLLDAATHAIPHDALWQWSADIPRDQVAYPYRIPEIRFFAPLPDNGEIRLDADPRFPAVDIQLLSEGRVLVAFRLVEILLPKGPLGAAPPESRRAFLRDRRYVPAVALSGFDGATTTLDDAVMRQSDWLPGNVARIYGVPVARRNELLAEVAVREHVARRAFVHPSTVVVEPDFTGARATVRPLRRHPLRVTRGSDAITVVDAAPPSQDLAPVRAYWRDRIGIGPWPIEDLYYGLIGRFVGDVVLDDPEAFAKVRGQSCLYLANHQVGIESLLFSVLASALSGTSTVTLAKAEHRTSWLGTLIAHSFAYPGVTDPNVITFFEREDRESLIKIVGDIAVQMQTTAKSAMVHVEGTRSLAARQPVVKMSSAFIDMAIAVGAPIVPVRFVGALPIEELTTRLEFPVGFGRQDCWIGRPILPADLAALPYKDRKTMVISAINGLGPDLATEAPAESDPAFTAAVDRWIAETGATPENAVLFTTLATLPNPTEEVRALCDAARTRKLDVGTDPHGLWLAELARRLYGPRGPSLR